MEQLSLTINMRVLLTGDIHAEEFSKLLLQISSRNLNGTDGYITIVKENGCFYQLIGRTYIERISWYKKI